MDSFVLKNMVTITQSTKQPLAYLVLLWAATFAVALFAVLGNLEVFLSSQEWHVPYVALLLFFALAYTTFRSAFPIEYRTTIAPHMVELSSTHNPVDRTILFKDEIKYFFKWRRVWYRPRGFTYNVRFVRMDDRIGLISLHYIDPTSTHKFFEAIRTNWGDTYVRDGQ